MGYALAGWLVVLGGLALYAVTVVLRERRLAALVSSDRRRWMDTSDD